MTGSTLFPYTTLFRSRSEERRVGTEGKEAFLKAWCAAISRHAKDGAEVAYPYTLDNFPWVRIEILDDSHGVPRVILSSEVQRKVQQSLGLPLDPVRQSYDISISISHDGPIASAVVMLEI